VCTANGIKIICQGNLGNDMSQIRECKTVAASDFVPTFGDVFQPCSIDPGNGGCHRRKVDVIDPTTFQPTGAPYNDVSTTPVLAPGAFYHCYLLPAILGVQP